MLSWHLHPFNYPQVFIRIKILFFFWSNSKTVQRMNDFRESPLFQGFCGTSREYARGRGERRNRFRPADAPLFSSESNKNVALIFRKIRCFNIHTCHQLVFDLGRSLTRYPSGLYKKSIRGRGPVWEGS